MADFEILHTVVPIVFSVGGVYAVFKWRLNKIERAVEQMAEMCQNNRTQCTGKLNDTMQLMRVEVKQLFKDSLEDRKEMRKEIVEMGKTLVRLDQRVLNGHAHD